MIFSATDLASSFFSLSFFDKSVLIFSTSATFSFEAYKAFLFAIKKFLAKPLLASIISLCWRARLLGAKVVLASNAVGRNVLTSERQERTRRRRVDSTRFGPRHRIRMIWANQTISKASKPD